MLRVQHFHDKIHFMKKKAFEVNRLPLFDGISADALSPLLVCLAGHEKNFSKGEIIILEEDQVRNVGVTMEGTVLMTKEDIWGNQTILAYMGPGDLFGETFAVRQKDQNSFVSFVASTDCRIYFVSFDRILHTCHKACGFHHKVIENMMDLVSAKNIRLMEKIEVTSKNTLREKILTYLSIQVQKQQSNQVEIALNRSELAGYLDSNRCAMTRELSHLKEEGVLDYDRNTFRVKALPQ